MAAALMVGACTLALAAPSTAAAQDSGFVTRAGSRLLLNGRPFRFAGANIYWLGVDENLPPSPSYPTPFRVDDALSTAVLMGATVVRAHTCGISVGSPPMVEPVLDRFNETALRHVDYAIDAARRHHLRLIIPLVDNWRYYHGGKHTFVEWIEGQGADQNDFYTNEGVIQAFERYVAAILNRVNTYTHVAYKDDPTIMAWETGNELDVRGSQPPPEAWTREIARFIKHLDAHHLVMDGYSKPANDAAIADDPGLRIADIDIVTEHYPRGLKQLLYGAATAARAGKAFVLGEYYWPSSGLPDLLSAIEQDPSVSGDCYWSLFPHADSHGFVQHRDGLTLHYPGDTPSMRAQAQMLRLHAYRMRGLRAAPPPGRPDAPTITLASADAGIAWRGVAGAASYRVERSTSGRKGPWSPATDGPLTDNDTPWRDAGHPVGRVWYRVRAANISGVEGPWSPPAQVDYPGGAESRPSSP